jgi:hypothetical protein
MEAGADMAAEAGTAAAADTFPWRFYTAAPCSHFDLNLVKAN